MHRVNPKMHEINMMDGSSFITWLQKLGRISEDILLGKIDEKSVTLDDFNFTEPPTPSAIATPLSRSPSSSHGTVLSLPNIKSKNRNSSPPPRSTLFSSPSTEIITSERTVSRGVGGEESISPTLTSQSRNSPARAAHSPSPSFILDELDFDPYLPYMAHSFDLFPNHKRSHNNDHQEEFQGSLCSPSSYSTSSFFDSTRNDSVVSVVTETPSMFSPIRAQTASSSSPNQPMVASLLGQNPWQDINPHQKRGRRPKTQSSALAHTH